MHHMTSALSAELDLTGIDLTESDPQTITGIAKRYAAALSANAPLLITGIVAGGDAMSPMFAVGSGYSIMLPIGATLTIDPTDDTITVTT